MYTNLYMINALTYILVCLNNSQLCIYTDIEFII